MRDRPESIVYSIALRPGPPPCPPGEPPPGFLWEDHAVFRETFLRYFTEPRAANALRVLGDFAYDMVLECWGGWPPCGEPLMLSELRAAAVDLRHLQGYLGAIGKSREVSSLPPVEDRLAMRSSTWSRQLGELAARIESFLPKPPAAPGVPS